MIRKHRKPLAALGLGLAAFLLPLAFGLTTPTAHASADKPSVLSTTPSPSATRTPRPIKLRPWVLFGHARPGSTETYRKLLFNRLPDEATVNLDGASAQGWDVQVAPEVATTIPGYANIITITVNVPEHPAHRLDIERVRAVLSATQPYTTTAYLITITRRHHFTDLPEGHWADDPVQYLLEEGVVTGYADGSFRPNENVTRAQFAKMLVVAMGWPIQTPTTPTFSDVSTSYWAYGYIETAAAHGAIAGYADGSFRPAAGVTRAQVAKMLYTARGWSLETPTTTEFTDVQPGHWSYTYVQAISSAEAMAGYADRTFRPNAPATRAQIAKVLTFSLFSDPNN